MHAWMLQLNPMDASKKTGGHDDTLADCLDALHFWLSL